MDSAGNSGSIQSSSGGDEEYDSAPVLISAATTPHHLLSSSLPLPSELPQLSSFDSFISDNYTLWSLSPPPPLQAPPPQNRNPLLHLDMSWGAIRPQTCTTGAEIDFSTLVASSNNPTISSPVPAGLANLQPLSSSDQPPSSAAAQHPRQSKKRPRASRRAPTTVLTTDTTNFRQMVQEFTGIPAPPFPSSAFPRSRFDLFSAAAACALRSAPERPYLLRPFAQKVPVPSMNPFLVPSSSSPPTATANISASCVGPTTVLTSTTSNATIDTITVTTSSAAPAAVCSNPGSGADPSPTRNYQLPSDHFGLTMQRNPVLTLQIPAGQNHCSPAMPFLYGSRPPMVPSAAGEFVAGGIAQRQVTAQLSAGVTGLYAAEGVSSRGGGGSNSHDGCGGGGDLPGWADGSAGEHEQLRSFVGCYGNSQVASGSKLGKAGSLTSAEDNAPGFNVSSRDGGMVKSWNICSSD